MMELGATVCRARDARCRACPVAAWCASRAAVAVAPRAAAGTRPRFEETNRWARGRIVAALAAGEGLPRELAPERLERALEGLVRDGLVRRHGTGFALG
jgi:A/G-specific adenine glycosylase